MLEHDFSKEKLLSLLIKQISNFFDIEKSYITLLEKNVDDVLQKLDICFSSIKNKYYNSNGKTTFNPYHSGQYTIFLYYFSHAVSNAGAGELASKIYYLNKIMNGVDLYYEIELPPIFFLEHPVGSVMGRARYGNRFCFQQNCTVGGNNFFNDIYPIIGDNVWMFANSAIIGNSTIGNNVYVGAGCLIKDQNIPSNSIVFGQSPNLIIKQRSDEYFNDNSQFNMEIYIPQCAEKMVGIS